MLELDLTAFKDAALTKENVSGYTHDFYNYPARFSPLFVREAIKTFTEPGDLVLDPFMGGGTTLVEAKILNRNSIGYDISSLAAFITGVKTSLYTPNEIIFIDQWFSLTINKLNSKSEYERPKEWIEKGYQKNLSNKLTWHIRRIFELYVYEVENTKTSVKIQNFLRCVLLKTGQWALDSKKIIPSTNDFRIKLSEVFYEMICGASMFYNTVKSNKSKAFVRHYNKPAEQVKNNRSLAQHIQPKLVVTSPPYPGVHVMYHRWQINGRRETPAPFWIANSLDGHGISHYAMGGRKQKELSGYFSNIKSAFTSIGQICTKDTVVVQLLAFSEPEWQLNRYLEVMEDAGFKETNTFDSRLWREVPNRKWYAQQKGKTASSLEVVLFHKLK